MHKLGFLQFSLRWVLSVSIWIAAPVSADDNTKILSQLYLTQQMYDKAFALMTNLHQSKKSFGSADEFWLEIAEIFFEQGEFDKAKKALIKSKSTIPALLHKKQLMVANILINTDRFVDAERYISKVGTGAEPWGFYARYNLGVSLVKNGEVKKGIKILSDLGKIITEDEEIFGVKDQANIILGYYYLKVRRPSQANIYFDRIRLKGPLANKALLGIGWTYAQLGQFPRAMTPWTALQSRNKYDNAVIESIIAVPYALSNMNSHNEAVENYRNAITIYKDEISFIENTIETINKKGWSRTIQGYDESIKNNERDIVLTSALVNPYLSPLVSNPVFQRNVRKYNGLFTIKSTLKESLANLTAYHGIVTNRAQSIPKASRQKDSRILKLIKETFNRYEETNKKVGAINETLQILNLNDQELLSLLKTASEFVTEKPSLFYRAPLNSEQNIIRSIALWDITTTINAAPNQAASFLYDEELSDFQNYAQFSASLALLKSHLRQIITAVNHQISNQENELNALITKALIKHKKLLRQYLAQAYIAFAQVKDLTHQRIEDFDE